jgi:hypothetical protein
LDVRGDGVSRVRRAERALLLALGVAALAAPSAQAGWLRATTIGPSLAATTEPPAKIAFDPSGNAALTFTDSTSVFLVRRPFHGRFTRRITVTRASNSNNNVSAEGVALPPGGDTVVLTNEASTLSGDHNFRDDFSAFIARPRAQSFPSPQHLLTLTGDIAPSGHVISTTRGEALAWVTQTPRIVPVFALPRGGSSFGPTRQLDRGGAASDVCCDLAADGSGGAFAAWTTSSSRTRRATLRLAYRRAGGTFGAGQTIYQAPRGGSVDLTSLAAAGNHRAVLVWDLKSRRGEELDELVVGPRSVGRPRRIKRVVGDVGPSGPTATINRNGAVALVWQLCGLNRFDQGCSTEATTVDTRGNIRPIQGLRGTFMSTAAPALSGDAAGNVALAWEASDGVRAAVLHPGDRRFATSRKLSARSTGANPPVAAFGPRGEAIVAFLDPDTSALRAAVYRTGR